MEDTAAWYRHWARVETHGASPTYERLALAVADAPRALALLAQVPRARRQPNLLLAALRWHGAPVHEPAAALDWLHGHPEPVLHVLRTRTTQTNEPARCALLLPALARLAARRPGPLAVVEVGASAGLCLLYDRWGYRYTTPTGHHDVDAGRGGAGAAVVLPCAVTGPVPLPAAVPAVAWRAGLDLAPLDPADADTRRWLACLVWPEHTDRAGRLRAALAVAAAEPPRVARGDMVTDLPALLGEARAALARAAAATGQGPGTLVVTHSAALVYLDPAQRARVRQSIAAAGAHRLGAEAAPVLPDVAERLPDGPDVGGQFVVSVDDTPLALSHPHGRTLTWL